MTWGFEPFEDVDGANAEAYSVGYADVEVYRDFGAVYAQLGGWLEFSPYIVFAVWFFPWEFGSKFRVYRQYSAPEVGVRTLMKMRRGMSLWFCNLDGQNRALDLTGSAEDAVFFACRIGFLFG